MRHTFGGSAADFVASNGRPRVGVTVTLWTARTGGTQVTDLLDEDGDPITSVTSGAEGLIPTFQGPDGVTELWALAGGARVRLDPSSEDEAIADAVAASVAAQAAASTASGAATTAQAAATAAQAAVAGKLDATAASATYVAIEDVVDVVAADVPVTPTGAIAATNVQAALAELDTEKATTGHSHTAPVASGVAFTPTGTISATNVQAAIAEVATEAGGGGGGGSTVVTAGSVYSSVTQAVGAGASLALTYDTILYDIGGVVGAGADSLVVPTGKAGLWELRAFIRWNSIAASQRTLSIFVDGVLAAEARALTAVTNGIEITLPAAKIRNLAAGAVITASAFASSAGTIQAGDTGCWLEARYLGPVA